MNFLPKIIAWYQDKPVWIKVCLFVVPIVAFLIYIFLVVFSKEKGMSETLVEGIQKQHEEREKKALVKDEKLNAKLKKEKEKRKDNKEEMVKDYEKSKNIHNDIDDADSVSALDSIDTNPRK